jgi:hypothetical protein
LSTGILHRSFPPISARAGRLGVSAGGSQRQDRAKWNAGGERPGVAMRVGARSADNGRRAPHDKRTGATWPGRQAWRAWSIRQAICGYANKQTYAHTTPRSYGHTGRADSGSIPSMLTSCVMHAAVRHRSRSVLRRRSPSPACNGERAHAQTKHRRACTSGGVQTAACEQANVQTSRQASDDQAANVQPTVTA